MKKCILLTFGLALLCAAMSTAALASENAYLYLIQGIPGLDYSSTTDPQFPVDVLLNDEVCYVHGLPFGTVDGPLTFVPGTYDLKISVANSLAPCSNGPIVEGSVSLVGGKNVSVVLALDSTGAPTQLTFGNTFTAVTVNDARILFALAADAPASTVVFQNTSTMKSYSYSANPGQLLDENLPAGNYTVTVTAGTTTLIPSTGIALYSQSVTLLYALGEAGNSTITLATKTIRNVI
jgi:hypothetical protein